MKISAIGLHCDSIRVDNRPMRSRTSPTTRLVIVALAAMMFLCLPAFLALAGA